MTIPSENLFYVLCYAWKRLDQMKALPADVRTTALDLRKTFWRAFFTKAFRRCLDGAWIEAIGS